MAYTPAGNLTTTGSLRHLASVYYSRKALDQLMKRFHFKSVTEPDEIPLRNGKTVQWYRYTLFSANTTAASEGVVGNSLVLDTNTVSATVAEYSDFITLSKLLVDTAIDPIVENASKQLSYRAGISVDAITRNEFDANVSSVTLNTLAANLSIADLRRAKNVMEANDVMPREDEDFVAIMHPYVFYDLISDNTAGGYVDKMRYADPNAALQGEAGKVEGCRVLKSTNVSTTGSAPNVQYYVYVVGKGAVGNVSLAGGGPQNVVDPSKQQFKINVIPGKPQIADPTGTIGGAVSYRFTYFAKTLDSTTYRYRIIPADSSLV